MRKTVRDGASRFALIACLTGFLLLPDEARAEETCVGPEELEVKLAENRHPISRKFCQEMNWAAAMRGAICLEGLLWANQHDVCVESWGGSVASVHPAMDKDCLDLNDVRKLVPDDGERKRCGGLISIRSCRKANEVAMENGFICEDAKRWLDSDGWCAITLPSSRAILLFCPVG